MYRIPMVEYKLDSEGTPCEYKTPFRRNTTWHRVPTSSGGQPLPRGSPTQGPEQVQCQPISEHIERSIPRSTSFDRKLPDIPRYSQNLTFCHLIFLHIHNYLYKKIHIFDLKPSAYLYLMICTMLPAVSIHQKIHTHPKNFK